MFTQTTQPKQMFPVLVPVPLKKNQAIQHQNLFQNNAQNIFKSSNENEQKRKFYTVAKQTMKLFPTQNQQDGNIFQQRKSSNYQQRKSSNYQQRILNNYQQRILNNQGWMTSLNTNAIKQYQSSKLIQQVPQIQLQTIQQEQNSSTPINQKSSQIEKQQVNSYKRQSSGTKLFQNQKVQLKKHNQWKKAHNQIQKEDPMKQIMTKKRIQKRKSQNKKLLIAQSIPNDNNKTSKDNNTTPNHNKTPNNNTTTDYNKTTKNNTTTNYNNKISQQLVNNKDIKAQSNSFQNQDQLKPKYSLLKDVQSNSQQMVRQSNSIKIQNNLNQKNLINASQPYKAQQLFKSQINNQAQSTLKIQNPYLDTLINKYNNQYGNDNQYRNFNQQNNQQKKQNNNNNIFSLINNLNTQQAPNLKNNTLNIFNNHTNTNTQLGLFNANSLIPNNQLNIQTPNNQLNIQISGNQLSKQVQNNQLSKQVQNNQLSKQVQNNQLSKQVQNNQLSKQVPDDQLSSQVQNKQFNGQVQNNKFNGQVQNQELNQVQNNKLPIQQGERVNYSSKQNKSQQLFPETYFIKNEPSYNQSLNFVNSTLPQINKTQLNNRNLTYAHTNLFSIETQRNQTFLTNNNINFYQRQTNIHYDYKAQKINNNKVIQLLLSQQLSNDKNISFDAILQLIHAKLFGQNIQKTQINNTHQTQINIPHLIDTFAFANIKNQFYLAHMNVEDFLQDLVQANNYIIYQLMQQSNHRLFNIDYPKADKKQVTLGYTQKMDEEQVSLSIMQRIYNNIVSGNLNMKMNQLYHQITQQNYKLLNQPSRILNKVEQITELNPLETNLSELIIYASKNWQNIDHNKTQNMISQSIWLNKQTENWFYNSRKWNQLNQSQKQIAKQHQNSQNSSINQFQNKLNQYQRVQNYVQQALQFIYFGVFQQKQNQQGEDNCNSINSRFINKKQKQYYDIKSGKIVTLRNNRHWNQLKTGIVNRNHQFVDSIVQINRLNQYINQHKSQLQVRQFQISQQKVTNQTIEGLYKVLRSIEDNLLFLKNYLNH